MRVQLIVAMLFIAFIGLTPNANGQLKNDDEGFETKLFRGVQPGELERLKTTGGLVIGEYLLTAPALQSLTKSKMLASTIHRIDTAAWDKPPFDRRNVNLTVRRMDHYLDTATAFYDGKGKRNERQKNLTDIELGDRWLSCALQSVKLADAWSISLKPGQAEILAAVIARRYAIAQSPSD